MEKVNIYLAIFAFSLGGYAQKIGINTQTPKVSLEIKNNLDLNIPNGLIVPKISGGELKAKDALYTMAQDGILVFVNEALSYNEASGKTIAVTEEGYYYYDGLEEIWVKMDRYTNVVAEKTIVQINRPNTDQQIFRSGTIVSWDNVVGSRQTANNVTLSGTDRSVIELAPGKCFKLMAMVGISASSSATYLKTQFVTAEPLSADAAIYLNTPGTVESSSLKTHKGSGTYPICYVYTGESGMKLRLSAKGPTDGTVTYIAGAPGGQWEGTFISIQEL